MLKTKNLPDVAVAGVDDASIVDCRHASAAK